MVYLTFEAYLSACRHTQSSDNPTSGWCAALVVEVVVVVVVVVVVDHGIATLHDVPFGERLECYEQHQALSHHHHHQPFGHFQQAITYQLIENTIGR